MDLKQFKVLVNWKLRPVAYEFLKDQVTLYDQQTRRFTPEEFDALLKEADAVLSVTNAPIGEAFLQKAPKLKMLAQMSVGYDHIDVAACHAHGVRVSNTPGVLTDTVADLGYGLIIDSARRIAAANKFVKDGVWSQRKAFGLTHDLAHKVLGIVGMGAIGSAIARRAVASKMEIIYHNPHRRNDEDQFPARYVDLEELLKTADVVLLACTLNPSTKGLMNKERLALMKPSAALINMSRGKVVDTDALVEALANKRLAYAGLDVTDPEPLPSDHPLLQFDNVTITPHMGNATAETRDAMAMLAAQNIVNCLAGEPLLSEVK